MGDHTAEASSAENPAAARSTAAYGDEGSVSRCSSQAEQKAARRTRVFLQEGVRDMGDHTPEASTAGNPAAATSTAANGDEDGVSRCSSQVAKKAARRTRVFLQGGVRDMGDHHTLEASSGGNPAAATSTAGHGDDDNVSRCSSQAEKKAAKRTRAFLQGGDNAGVCSSKVARRAVANGDEERGRVGALPSRRASVPVPGAEADSTVPVVLGGGISGSSAASGGRVRPEALQEGGTLESVRAGGVKPQNQKRRLIDFYDVGLINRTSLAAVGGEMPAILQLAADKERIKAATARMAAMARKNQIAGGLPAPSRAPVQPRPQPQPQPQPDPEPQLERRRLLQPDLSCPRCHVNNGTVAQHHLCKCRHCSNSEDICPFCFLAAIPKTDCSRSMCPSCGGRVGKLMLDHVCSCDICHDCPRCDLAKLPRPLPRRDGACPCCDNAGNASRHLCLCSKCRLVPGSACPYCALAEEPSPIRPFESIRLEAYSLK